MRKSEDRVDKSKKLFVLNTRQKIYTLHINDGRCCQIRGLVKWVDFETEQSAVKCADNNLKRCRTCFPKE